MNLTDDKTEMRTWPTREQWAENRTTVYAGMNNPQPASRWLANDATDEEAVPRDRRREINEMLKALRRGRLPERIFWDSARPALLDAIVAR
jgi:hypothetical protein